MCSYTTLQFVVITTLICDRRLFFHITVLQSSVAAHMRCGEIFINFIAVKLQENLPLKKMEIRLTINSWCFTFLEHGLLGLGRLVQHLFPFSGQSGTESRRHAPD